MTNKFVFLQIEPGQDEVSYRATLTSLGEAYDAKQNKPRVFFVMRERTDKEYHERPHPYAQSEPLNARYLYYKDGRERERHVYSGRIDQDFNGVNDLERGEAFFAAVMTNVRANSTDCVNGDDCLFVATTDEVTKTAQASGMKAVTYDHAPAAIAALDLNS